MEGLIKKYQQKFRKVRDEMEQWEAIQARFVLQFRNASSIIERLKEIQDSQNYGALKGVPGIEDAVLQKQTDKLDTLFLSMKKTLEEFQCIVSTLQKHHRDGTQLVRVGSDHPSRKQLQNRIGIKPCIADCLDGLALLCDMHQAEYRLKSSLFSALSHTVLKPSPSDLSALQQLLIDQPNISKDEVQHIFDIVLAEEIS